MSYSLQNTTSLTSLADAIRSKTGDSASMTVEEMITAVNSITTGGGSSGGWMLRKEFYETSTVSGVSAEIIHGSYIDIDTELAQDKAFIFLFTSTSKGSSSSAGADHVYLLFYDGSKLVPTDSSRTAGNKLAQALIPLTNDYDYSFEVNYDSSTQTNVIRINNNETSGSYDVDLYKNAGYKVNGKYVWGNMFYLDESFNEVPTINISNLALFNAGGRSNQIIDVLWDKLTYNIQNSNLEYAFVQYSGSHTDWRDKTISIQENAIVSLDYMFQQAEIKYPPKIVIEGAHKTLGSLRWLYYSSKIKEIANDSITIGSDVVLSYGSNNANRQRIFEGCKYLTSIPDNFLAEIMYQTSNRGITYGGRTISSGMFQGCHSLQNIIGMPYEGLNTNTMTSNMFSDSFFQCYSLRHLTFYKPNGNVGTMNAVNQTIDLSQYVGYQPNNETQAELQQRTEDNQAYFINSNEDYIAHISDTHAYGGNSVSYSTYNRQSAIETINSLPDTTAAIAAAGGTNTIKFKSGAGSAYDELYNMSNLSAEEIAVATAKGWTVSLV